MNNDDSRKTLRRQRSVFFRLPDPSELSIGLYRHMLLEDVSLGIMPIGGRSSRSHYSVTTSPADKRAAKIIAGGLASRDRYYRDSLAELCGHQRHRFRQEPDLFPAHH